MQHFIAIVHQEEDSAFGVSFPDVPGCFSAADSFDQIIPNAVEALTLWFEDADMIDASPLSAVRESARDDLAEGAMLIAVPLFLPDTKVVRANISLEKGVLDAIDAAAKQRGLNRSAFISEAARNEIQGRH